MKYSDYREFSEEFGRLIEELRWSEDQEIEERTINSLTEIQTLNPKFADRYLLTANALELAILMEVGE